VLVRDHDVPLPRGRSLEVRTTGLWADHTCETPLEHWTVGVEAFGVSLDDPREAFGGERGDPCPLGLDLEWETMAGDGTGSTAPDVGSGYEQPCTVHGEVLVGSERIDLDGFGWRSHWWGDRDWWSGEAGGRQVWAGGHLEDGTPFGTHEPEVVTDGGLVVTATLSDLGLTATPLAHAPFAVPGPDGRRSRLDRALCRYQSSDGRRGTGWVERLTPPPPEGPARP
jgi:hypothetical protein